MPKFSQRSLARLHTCDPVLQEIFKTVVLEYDCTIIQGHRTADQHAQYLREGRTRVPYSRTKHRHSPSRAVDVSPWPIPDKWGDLNSKERAKFYHFAGYVKAVAWNCYGVKLRWGGDWDGDKDFDDQSFDDLVHFELA